MSIKNIGTIVILIIWTIGFAFVFQQLFFETKSEIKVGEYNEIIYRDSTIIILKR